MSVLRKQYLSMTLALAIIATLFTMTAMAQIPSDRPLPYSSLGSPLPKSEMAGVLKAAFNGPLKDAELTGPPPNSQAAVGVMFYNDTDQVAGWFISLQDSSGQGTIWTARNHWLHGWSFEEVVDGVAGLRGRNFTRGQQPVRVKISWTVQVSPCDTKVTSTNNVFNAQYFGTKRYITVTSTQFWVKYLGQYRSFGDIPPKQSMQGALSLLFDNVLDRSTVFDSPKQLSIGLFHYYPDKGEVAGWYTVQIKDGLELVWTVDLKATTTALFFTSPHQRGLNYLRPEAEVTSVAEWWVWLLPESTDQQPRPDNNIFQVRYQGRNRLVAVGSEK